LAQANGSAGVWTSKHAARYSGYSLSHLRLAFLQTADGTLADGLRRVRLSQAAAQLAAGATVTQASLDAGFQTPESFGKAFRRAFYTTPSAFAAGQTQGVLHARAARLAVALAAALSATPKNPIGDPPCRMTSR
jgi:AraC family transcriptional regulator